VPNKTPDTSVHTYVPVEAKQLFCCLAQENGLTHEQLVSFLLGLHGTGPFTKPEPPAKKKTADRHPEAPDKAHIHIRLPKDSFRRFKVFIAENKYTHEEGFSRLLTEYQSSDGHEDDFTPPSGNEMRLQMDIDPKVKTDARRIANKYQVSYAQLLDAMLDNHYRPKAPRAPDRATTPKADDPRLSLGRALDSIREKLLAMLPDENEKQALAHQLEESRAETAKIKQNYEQLVGTLTSMLQTIS